MQERTLIYLRKIKHVKGVSYVSHCPSLPFVPIVPNAVTKQNVGEGCKSFGTSGENWVPVHGGLHSEGGLCPTFQNEVPSHQVTPDPERLCKPAKELISQREIASSNRQVASRKGGCPVISSHLQPVISSSTTQQQMETYLGPQSVKSVFQSRYLQNGYTRNNPVISTERGMGNVAGLQRHIFSHPHQSKSRNYLRFFLNKQTYKFTTLPFGLATSPWSLQRWSRK